MKVLNYIALAILIIGGLNWGLIGIFNFNLVATLFGGSAAMLSKIIYILVGIAAVWSFTFFNKVDDQIKD